MESLVFFCQQSQGPTRPQGFPTASCMLLALSSWSYNHPALPTGLKAFQSSFLLFPFVSERCLFLWRGLQPGVMLHSLHLECVHHLHITTVIITRLHGQMNKAHTSKRSRVFLVLDCTDQNKAIENAAVFYGATATCLYADWTGPKCGLLIAEHIPGAI